MPRAKPKSRTKKRPARPRPRRPIKRGGGVAIAALEQKCLSRDIIPITGRGEKYKSAAALARKLDSPGARTYRVYSQIDGPMFESMLDARGWKKQTDARAPSTLLHIDILKDKPPGFRIAQFAVIKNKLDGHHAFVDKDHMWTNADAAMRRHMKRSTLDRRELDALKLPVIIKPAMLGRGLGITASDNRDTLRRAWDAAERPVGQEYILNPYLFRGRKCHFRVYFMVTAFVVGGALTKYGWLCREGVVVTANLPYVKENYNDKDIHDTHLDSTDDLYFVSKLPDYAELYGKMIEAMRNTVVYKKYFTLYKDQRHGYGIYGSDMMYDTVDHRAYLIEANFRAAYQVYSLYGGKEEISRAIFGGVMAVIDSYYAGRYAGLTQIPGFMRVW